ncbi:hypothetical protein [Luteibacter sp. Lutesp34]|uniref:hypothetical protein n=1 Tax=Luteibacter sp. Lutesp34 TaxID=3243030 RepID=UPI0039B50C29
MMRRSVLSLLSATLLLGATVSHANSPAYVDSKEYKVLLDATRFASNPSSAAATLLHDVSARLSTLGFDKTVTGSSARATATRWRTTTRRTAAR